MQQYVNTSKYLLFYTVGLLELFQPAQIKPLKFFSSNHVISYHIFITDQNNYIFGTRTTQKAQNSAQTFHFPPYIHTHKHNHIYT